MSMGWLDLPLKCPGCSRRLVEHHVLTYGGAIKCRHCERLYYVALASNLNMAFAIEVSTTQLADLKRRALSLPQVLAHFGATYPVSP